MNTKKVWLVPLMFVFALLAGCPDSGFVGGGWGEAKDEPAKVVVETIGDGAQTGNVTINLIEQEGGANFQGTVGDNSENLNETPEGSESENNWRGIPGCSSESSYQAGFCAEQPSSEQG